MRADANLPARLTKHARKLLGRRRREIDREADDDPPTCDDIAPDWVDVPGWRKRRTTGKRHANHNGTILQCFDGSYASIALDLNELA